MRSVSAFLALLTVVGSVACGREGPVGNASDAHTEAEDSGDPIVLTDRDHSTGLRLTVSPAHPHAGDDVSFVAEMTVGDPPYGRRASFTYDISVEGAGGESLMDSCAAPPSPRPGSTPAPPKPRRQILRRTYTFFESGPHDFSMGIRPACSRGLGDPRVEGKIDVLPARPENTHRWTGSTDRWSAEVTVLPRAVTLGRNGFHLVIDRKDDRPISWKISYGDGHDKVGGHACEPDAPGADESRFERKYVHWYNRPAEFRVTVEVSNECLRSPDARGMKVINETLFVRPRPLQEDDAFFLPSHRSDDVPAGSLADVDIVGDPSSRCVWLQRADGSRIAALWPAGFHARFDPLRVFNDKQAEVFREGKLRDVGGAFSAAHADRVPEKCRVGERLFWVDRLRAY